MGRFAVGRPVAGGARTDRVDVNLAISCDSVASDWPPKLWREGPDPWMVGVVSVHRAPVRFPQMSAGQDARGQPPVSRELSTLWCRTVDWQLK
jgi:hypothetical protein